MSHRVPDIQTGGPPPWVTGLVYISALASGVVLICGGRATPAESSGFVAPFLVLYERTFSRHH